jgi:hypothetical protein
VRSSDSQYAAAGTDPSWPPLLKGGEAPRDIRGGISPLFIPQVSTGQLDPGAYAAGLYDVASSRLRCWRAPIQGLRGLRGLEPGAYAAGLYDVASSRLVCFSGNPGLTPPGYMMSPLRG